MNPLLQLQIRNIPRNDHFTEFLKILFHAGYFSRHIQQPFFLGKKMCNLYFIQWVYTLLE